MAQLNRFTNILLNLIPTGMPIIFIAKRSLLQKPLRILSDPSHSQATSVKVGGSYALMALLSVESIISEALAAVQQMVLDLETVVELAVPMVLLFGGVMM